jgi:hypothetical protein
MPRMTAEIGAPLISSRLAAMIETGMKNFHLVIVVSLRVVQGERHVGDVRERSICSEEGGVRSRPLRLMRHKSRQKI